MMRRFDWLAARKMARLTAVMALAALLSSCASQRVYRYEYRRGYSAEPVGGGLAAAPRKAPRVVRQAIAAGNEIVGSPYHYGGGHGREDGFSGYDCSGAVSHVLMRAGLLSGARPSSGFLKYGRRGEGDWITIYAKKGHVFLVVADLRFDTGWHQYPEGPRWTTKPRPLRGYVARHPPGL